MPEFVLMGLIFLKAYHTFFKYYKACLSTRRWQQSELHHPPKYFSLFVSYVLVPDIIYRTVELSPPFLYLPWTCVPFIFNIALFLWCIDYIDKIKFENKATTLVCIYVRWHNIVVLFCTLLSLLGDYQHL